MSIFCEVYGDTKRNRIIEYFMENQHTEMAVGDIARQLKISRPKAYEVMDDGLKKGYVTKSRIIGRTQLYKLKRDHPIIKIFLRNFKECLNMELDKHIQKQSTKNWSSSNGAQLAYAKGI